MRVPTAPTLLVLLTAALAGCSGGGSDDGATPAPMSGSLSSTTPPPPPLPTSDTLHFLIAPDMAPALPEGSAESATPVTVGNFGQGGGGQGPDNEGAEWRHVVEARTNATAGEVHIWIQVKETLLQQPDNQAFPQCSWALTVELGADLAPIEACIQEPPGPVNPGTKELVFQLILDSPVELEANETIMVRLERAGFSLSPNNAVDALSGSADHDSRIVLKGLREPIRD